MEAATYAELFLDESREHLAVINNHLLALERRSATADAVDAIFRSVHNLKGMSAAMGFARATRLSHAIENLLDTMRGSTNPDPELLQLLFRWVDRLERCIDEAVMQSDAGGEGSSSVPPPPAEHTQDAAPERPVDGRAGEGERQGETRTSQRVRVDLRHFDNMMKLVDELVSVKSRLADFASVDVDPELHALVARMSIGVDALQHEAIQARMAPVAGVFDRFPRGVRDAARELGKLVALTMEGRETELDRSILDELSDPLVHLLRNAIDHGIETPDDRVAAGKVPAGQITLSARREGDVVVIEVRDDGRGIDRRRIVEAARKRGIACPDTDNLNNQSLLELLARPGFSTADHVSDVSGRGVGIDVVMTRLRIIGGSLELDTATGRGTTFTLRLPPASRRGSGGRITSIL